ncbi:hypothetical protein PR048_013368 [Dryococelus australis]|uniref:Uncharacterized protein n=1 Tax=Dryococelus australis TaxID=614101 RepID=A0ABQ9HTI0_9NEOP|nr:hypothetical protein PR048_013368 [Dryococelus australis]
MPVPRGGFTHMLKRKCCTNPSKGTQFDAHNMTLVQTMSLCVKCYMSNSCAHIISRQFKPWNHQDYPLQLNFSRWYVKTL